MEAKEPLSILIIDDNPVDRMMYRGILTRASSPPFLFLEAEQGEHGLRLCQEKQPDCILLDFELPDCNGLEFLTRLRADCPETPSLPVIVLSGHEDEELANKTLEYGAQIYMKKGELDFDTLFEAILRISQKHQNPA